MTEMLLTNPEQMADDAWAPPVVGVWLPSETLAADVVVLLTGVLVFVVSVGYLGGNGRRCWGHWLVQARGRFTRSPGSVGRGRCIDEPGVELFGCAGSYSWCRLVRAILVGRSRDPAHAPRGVNASRRATSERAGDRTGASTDRARQTGCATTRDRRADARTGAG